MNLTNTCEKVWKSKHTLSWTELWARITTAARGCCSAESLCSSSEWMFLERRQFLPVLFTATPQCLELRQDNIRVCTIWADSLPLRSPLDLGSVFFFTSAVKLYHFYWFPVIPRGRAGCCSSRDYRSRRGTTRGHSRSALQLFLELLEEAGSTLPLASDKRFRLGSWLCCQGCQGPRTSLLLSLFSDSFLFCFIFCLSCLFEHKKEE